MTDPTADIQRWLLRVGPRLDSVDALLRGLVDEVHRSGLPLRYASFHVRTLHPQLQAWSYMWWRDRGWACVERPHHDVMPESFIHSPVGVLHRQRGPFRRRLRGPQARIDYPVLAEFATAGGTDYIADRVVFGNDSINVVSWLTDARGGWSDADLAVLEGIRPALATVLELQVRRALAETLLETYLGRMTGRRVLDGSIARGARERLLAVVWACDLRGFTTLSEQHPPHALLELLDAFFEAVAGAVAAGGGEVLKFLGDGLLAIFPVGRAADPADVCRDALTAAAAARGRVAAMPMPPEIPGPVHFGLALHVGDVIYGNVGAPDRLDFTVVGPAVNRAARIEALTKQLDEPTLTSGEFAAFVPDAVRPVGTFELRGVPEPVEVFAVRG